MMNKPTSSLVRLTKRHLLTKEGSSKATYHIELEHSLSYMPGDSIALYAPNDEQDVKAITSKCSTILRCEISHKKLQHPLSFENFIRFHACLRTDQTRLRKALLGKYPECPSLLSSIITHIDSVDEIISLISFIKITPPRYYSIASSPLYSKTIHLTVGHIVFDEENNFYDGHGSGFLCRRMAIGDACNAYVHKADHFKLPDDNQSPIIMIGPGTGIAPFIGFLQHRQALKTKHSSWLFFGERHKESHFYYQDFLEKLVANGDVKLTTTFSRDGNEMRYVQHALAHFSKEIYNELINSTIFYICGDKSKMAKDVISTLKEILQKHGKMSSVESDLFIKSMKSSKQLQLDVY